MTFVWKDAILSQFLATIDMFERAIQDCPNDLWEARLWNDPKAQPGFSEFWYVAYHTLFWLDLYLSGAVEGFTPPEPYNLDELDPRGLLPNRVFTKTEMLDYLAYCRQKCRKNLLNSTVESLGRLCYFPWSPKGITYGELLLDNMRHVQEHGSQLRMLLGQQASTSSRWIGQTREGDTSA